MSESIRFAPQQPCSILLLTLDSCRYDTFAAASAANMKGVGPLHRAKAPGSFTYSSHAAMFMGFTPGIADLAEPHVNPKFGKIFRVVGAGLKSKVRDFHVTSGRNIIHGFKNRGYRTYGSGSVGWFNPQTETGQNLTADFDEFHYPGDTCSLDTQLQWLSQKLTPGPEPVFAFLNVGETHVPYYYRGAPWNGAANPCVPFSKENDAGECRRRQLACLEYVDRQIAPLLAAFAQSTIVICADHGDCWGEDGLWEHGICHEKVLEVPLIYRLGDRLE